MQLTMTARSCPICGSSDESRVYAPEKIDAAALDSYAFASRKLPEYMHARLIECPSCDLVYANPALSAGALAEAYHQAAFDSAVEAGYASRTYGEFLPQITARLTHRQGALDIGTGEGSFLAELLRAGFTHVQGVEPSAAPIAAADPEIRPLIRHEMFEADRYEPASLSLVTCFQTMEHLKDPLTVCQDIARILRPGGAVFFVDHNRRALSARILGTKSPIFDVEHLQLYSPTSLTRLLASAGFKDISISTVKNRYPLAYWLKLFPLPRTLKLRLLEVLTPSKLGKINISIPAGNIAAIGYKP